MREGSGNSRKGDLRFLPLAEKPAIGCVERDTDKTWVGGALLE